MLKVSPEIAYKLLKYTGLVYRHQVLPLLQAVDRICQNSNPGKEIKVDTEYRAIQQSQLFIGASSRHFQFPSLFIPDNYLPDG